MTFEVLYFFCINNWFQLTWNILIYRNIYATENLSVSILAIGEGWHNYHHTFPWDYKTSELGKYSTNFTTAFIDLMAKIGWAYDLKSVSEEMVKNRTRRTGDGTHAAWRWNDKDQSIEEKHSVDLFTELWLLAFLFMNTIWRVLL